MNYLLGYLLITLIFSLVSLVLMRKSINGLFRSIEWARGYYKNMQLDLQKDLKWAHNEIASLNIQKCEVISEYDLEQLFAEIETGYNFCDKSIETIQNLMQFYKIKCRII